ncbi:hypothetical protein [Sphingorhabdus sp. Alg239-R122]|uniref:hypothetical protein n=1 Tax=Sphingorhabdus sp. Alg239-R122 TaxID=2305989 RepID=UPI0013DB0AD8|nr:hypothetical protein [Sphingorhabdus sp. Alg239-R122]
MTRYFKSILCAMALFTLALPHGAYAQAGQMFMITEVELEPAKSAETVEHWKGMMKIAKEQGYAYPIWASSSANRITQVSPLENFSDLDKMFAARGEVYNGGGDAFKNHLRGYMSGIANLRSFMVRHNADASHMIDGMTENFGAMAISEFKVAVGKVDEMENVLKDYKALFAKSGFSHGYNVYQGALGVDGGTFYIINYGKDRLELAQQEAAENKLFEGNAAMGELFGKYLAIATPEYFATEYTRSRPDLTYSPE